MTTKKFRKLHKKVLDITKRMKYAFIGIAEALAIFVGGFLAGSFGFKILFYIVSVIFIISTTILFRLKE